MLPGAGGDDLGAVARCAGAGSMVPLGVSCRGPVGMPAAHRGLGEISRALRVVARAVTMTMNEMTP